MVRHGPSPSTIFDTHIHPPIRPSVVFELAGEGPRLLQNQPRGEEGTIPLPRRRSSILRPENASGPRSGTCFSRGSPPSSPVVPARGSVSAFPGFSRVGRGASHTSSRRGIARRTREGGRRRCSPDNAPRCAERSIGTCRHPATACIPSIHSGTVGRPCIGDTRP